MRSADLARLAGVTVRTVRHYHQIGALPEPPRTSNGYRDYSVRDLIRVLRIRQLSSLGIPLEHSASLLDDGPGAGDAAELLEQLDRQLAEQAERIDRQRQLIARLRDHGAPPDLPAELAPFAAVIATAGGSSRLSQSDRDQAILLSHFADDAGRTTLAALYRSLAERPDRAADFADLSRRFEDLEPSSSDEQVEDLVERFAAFFTQFLAELEAEGVEVNQTGDLGAAPGLLEEYGAEAYHEPHRRALELLATRLAGFADG